MVRNLLLYICLVFTSVNLFGAIYYVSNKPGSDEDFSSIQSAVEFASSNDTIYVKGSPINYGNVLLEKPLVLIGEGLSGNEQTEHTAKLTRILFTSNPYRRTISSGSIIVGFEFPYFPGQRPNIITITNEHETIKDVVIERNWLWFVHMLGTAENWVFRNNIIRGWVNGGASDSNEKGAKGIFFQNNIINSLMGFRRGLTMEHNIIMGKLKDIQSAVVTRNIFTYNKYFLENVYGSQFRNNLASNKQVGDENGYTQPTLFESRSIDTSQANNGSGNKTGVDPGFIFWPSNDIKGGSVFQLAAGSPARGSGGTEAGIFGGKYPFPVTAFQNPSIEDPFPSFVTSVF